jgi:hypothetical protein
MQGQAQKAQADQQAAELRQNALYLNNAARDAERRGAIESDWQRVSTQAAIGSQRVAQAGSGGVVDQQSQAKRGMMTSILGGAAQGFGAGGGFSAFGGGASSAGSVNLQGQARPLTNNSAYVSRM